ncbi:hypothetical protein ACX93W_22885 [Paenibacillus sp. CAU 1782]
MHRVDKIKFIALFGETPEAPCYGYIELDKEGTLLALYNSDGEEIDIHGGHEYVRVRIVGKFDNEDRDHFYDLLESDGVG